MTIRYLNSPAGQSGDIVLISKSIYSSSGLSMGIALPGGYKNFKVRAFFIMNTSDTLYLLFNNSTSYTYNSGLMFKNPTVSDVGGLAYTTSLARLEATLHKSGDCLMVDIDIWKNSGGFYYSGLISNPSVSAPVVGSGYTFAESGVPLTSVQFGGCSFSAGTEVYLYGTKS